MLSENAKVYKYYNQEKKMLVVDFPIFYLFFNVEDDIKKINYDTECMKFTSLNSALDIACNRSILHPIE